MSRKIPLPAPKLINPCPDPGSRIAMVSLPVPLGSPGLNVLGDLPTQVQTVGVWPASQAGEANVVRRQLMFALAEGPLPDALEVGHGPEPSGAYRGPAASCSIVSEKKTGIILREVNDLVLTHGARRLHLRMGLKHAGQYHWWEWVRVEQLWSGPLVRAIRAGGFIEVETYDDDHFATMTSPLQSKTLHRHNWLRGDVYALLFANGVVHLTCRHVNNHLFDHGQDLDDVLPVIAFKTAGPVEIGETLDGSKTRFDLDGMVLNLAEAASLVGPDYPGRLAAEGDLVVYQPYEGVEIFGDSHHRERPDGYIVRAGEKRFPKGVAKSVRFAIGMGRAEPLITRFVVPDWWYAAAREFWGDDVLPVHDAADAVIEACERTVARRAAQRPGCFDDAVLTKNIWEGEIAYSQMLYFYRSGNLDYFHYALTDCYHHADIGFDHATETIRMHDYPFGAIAPPLYRTVSMTYGYLETGDPYLLECSESAASHYYWIDRHNWPRRSYGRDAASLRSLIFLWDYTGKEDYLAMAREALGRCAQCQRPDGSYGDQGGAVGACGGMANEITKPWMAMLASDPFVDYLIRRPNDPLLEATIRKTGDFIVASQLEKDGVYYWAYQYRYGEDPGDPWAMRNDPGGFARHPIGEHVSGYKARFLPYLTLRTGDPKYLEAWQRCFDTYWIGRGKAPTDVGYTTNKAIQYLPYAQAHLWNARVEGRGVRIRPLLTGWSPRLQGEISTPFGRLTVRCSRENHAIRIETESLARFNVTVELPGQAEPVRLSSNTSRVVES